jgi:dienelactone hydrolase
MDEQRQRAVSVQVPLGDSQLVGDLTLPEGAHGLVLFAHGSGSSRRSPRNRQVARALERRGLATLLIDLLTPDEESVDDQTAHFRFDIDLLARRLAGILDWLERYAPTRALRVGLFGASTGGGAALVTTARRPGRISAVVSRGGRPDLAGAALKEVTAPTLLIVGSLDTPVIRMNQTAMSQMRGDVSLEIVEGATHLFEEPGTLDRVAALAGDFFVRHLMPAEH